MALPQFAGGDDIDIAALADDRDLFIDPFEPPEPPNGFKSPADDERASADKITALSQRIEALASDEASLSFTPTSATATAAATANTGTRFPAEEPPVIVAPGGVTDNGGSHDDRSDESHKAKSKSKSKSKKKKKRKSKHKDKDKDKDKDKGKKKAKDKDKAVADETDADHGLRNVVGGGEAGEAVVALKHAVDAANAEPDAAAAAGEALVDAVAHETEEAGEEVVCERIDIGDVDPVDLLPQVAPWDRGGGQADPSVVTQAAQTCSAGSSARDDGAPADINGIPVAKVVAAEIPVGGDDEATVVVVAPVHHTGEQIQAVAEPPPVRREAATPAATAPAPTAPSTPTTVAPPPQATAPISPPPFQPASVSPTSPVDEAPVMVVESQRRICAPAIELDYLHRFEETRVTAEERLKAEHTQYEETIRQRIDHMRRDVAALKARIVNRAGFENVYAGSFAGSANVTTGYGDSETVSAALSSLAIGEARVGSFHRGFAIYLQEELGTAANDLVRGLDERTRALLKDLTGAVGSMEQKRNDVCRAFAAHTRVLALAAEALATDQANPDGSNALAALHDDPYITELKYRGALRRLAQEKERYRSHMKTLFTNFQGIDYWRIVGIQRILRDFWAAEKRLAQKLSGAIQEGTTAASEIDAKGDVREFASTAFPALSTASTFFNTYRPKIGRHVIRMGYLERQQGMFSSWKTNFCVLTASGFLHVYEAGLAAEDIVPGERIAESIQVCAFHAQETLSDDLQGISAFELSEVRPPSGLFKIFTSARYYLFRSRDEDDNRSWVAALSSARASAFALPSEADAATLAYGGDGTGEDEGGDTGGVGTSSAGGGARL